MVPVAVFVSWGVLFKMHGPRHNSQCPVDFGQSPLKSPFFLVHFYMSLFSKQTAV